MRTTVISLAVVMAFVVISTQAETVTIEAARDATLIQHPTGALANGSGPALFVGRTGQAANAVRRGLVYFDVAGSLPKRAIIERVFLTLHLSQSNARESIVSAHRVLDDWGEGPSFSQGGAGAAAEPGDSTWVHTFYDSHLWVLAGGQFVAAASADSLVEGSEAYAWWRHTPKLAADVRVWLHAPHRNFGWILIGDEATGQSVLRFDSRESPVELFRPMLTVEYRLPHAGR